MKTLLLVLVTLVILTSCSKPKEVVSFNGKQSISATKQSVSTAITASHMETYLYYKTIKRKNLMQEHFVRQVETYLEYKNKKLLTKHQQDFVKRINIILDDLNR